MTFVTIPTASYVRDLRGRNLMVPENLIPNADFNQQLKLWRFYCTCFDTGSPHYRLEDFHNKNLTVREKYLIWAKGWKEHYADVSSLIILYKRAKSIQWLHADEQTSYRNKLENLNKTRFPNAPVPGSKYLIESSHTMIVNERLDGLRRTAQHLLNARYTNKLASQALVIRRKQKELNHSSEAVKNYYDSIRRGENIILTPA